MNNPLPILPLKNTVVYPEIVVPLAVGRAQSLAAIKAAAEVDNRIITVAQLDPKNEHPERQDLYDVGTIARISRIERREDGAQVIVQGESRIALAEGVPSDSFLSCSWSELPALTIDENDPDSAEIEARLQANLALARQIAKMYDSENGEQIFQQLIGSLPAPITQMYRIASLANLKLEQEQKVLACNSVVELMQTIHEVLTHEMKVTEVRREIADQARDDLEQQQREHVLRQQKRAIESALGESGEDEDLHEIRQLLKDADLPPHVTEEVDRELKRLSRMSESASDYQVARSYLELVAELPWSAKTEDQLDLPNALTVLDEDHFGLEDVKERIIEFLAVMRLNAESKAPIICLVGPPGVGKTSLGHSIARAMGRKFERLSLGGLHDEAELRGHRRTYIGAMPGRIIQGIRRAGVTNPILMLDEIDKLGKDFRGDPSAALMEILDPAQNNEFRDNYLNLPYDLSNVFFITTANTLEGIPRPLLDRMEVLELSGYSDQEKEAIATQYLVPRQRVESGLDESQLDIQDDALHFLIRRYTREAGVRELERTIGRLARKRARQVVEGAKELSSIDIATVTELLGPEKFKDTDQMKTALHPGVAAGLAWTEVGGDVLYIEAARLDKDEVLLTGHLGQVMQESARAARSHIWSRAEDFGIDRAEIECGGVHIHVPQGAVPKDGPSAGITMATALASLYTGRAVPDDLAMTGELTLSGVVLPVGGIKEKLLAAHRAGKRRIIVPQDNEADLAKLPDAVRDELTIHTVGQLAEVLFIALGAS